MKLNFDDFCYLGICLEGFSYGLYSGIFIVYLHYHALENATGDKTKNILHYAICFLYVLSATTITVNMALSLIVPPSTSYLKLFFSLVVTSGCCIFISQSILIYRCWIVWGRNIRVVIIPSIIAIIFLATWLSASGSYIIVQDKVSTTRWGSIMIITSVIMALPVNLLVTALTVFRILKVFREIKIASGRQTLGATGGSKLRYIIFVLIESGMTMFSFQLVDIVTAIYQINGASSAWPLTAGIQQMLYGIAPTFILVRVSMGLSFHDEQSLEQVTVSLCLAPDCPNPIPETESISNVPHESRVESDIGVRLSNGSDIQVVER